MFIGRLPPGAKKPTVAYLICGVVVSPLLLGLFRERVRGWDNIPDEGGFVLASNHLSVIDPWPLAAPFYPRQVRFMAKAELFRPGLRWLLRQLGAFPVRRGHGDVGAVKTAAQLVEEGDILLIFPEGTQIGKTDGTKLRRELRRGAALIALHSGAPLVPVVISGTNRLARLARFRVAYGPSVDLDDIRDLPRREAAVIATQRLKAALEGMLADLHGLGEEPVAATE